MDITASVIKRDGGIALTSTDAAMNRTYVYRGFEIAVDAEAVWPDQTGTVVGLRRGFIAVVRISRASEPRVELRSLRLTLDANQPFRTEGGALTAGFSAGQRLIDDILAS
jgi:hypothetical protein